jgi:hypothetical protein
VTRSTERDWTGLQWVMVAAAIWLLVSILAHETLLKPPHREVARIERTGSAT